MAENNSSRLESSDILVSEPVSNQNINEISFGDKIKSIRQNKKISLDHLANETGFSINQLTSIENNSETPSVGMLIQLSRALGIESGYFLKKPEKESGSLSEAYQKRTQNYSYTGLTPGAENKHLKAFKVTIDANKDHSGVGYLHEGEEFNYVLSGKIEVTVGNHVNTLQKGDSLHFNSGIKHNLRNIGNEPAELLVVIYTP